MFSRKVANDSGDDVALVLAVGTLHWNQSVFGVQIMLNKAAGWKFSARISRAGSEHLDDFVWANQTPLTHANDLLLVLGQRFYRKLLSSRTESDE